jgi:hypothetical protein
MNVTNGVGRHRHSPIALRGSGSTRDEEEVRTMAVKKVTPKSPAKKQGGKKRAATRVTRQTKALRTVRSVRAVRAVQNVQ